MRDIVGLYMDAPLVAMLLYVDEKSQIQALDRTQTLQRRRGPLRILLGTTGGAMMETDQSVIDDLAVYLRTSRGQQELLVGSRLLNRTERRLLGMVTGLTTFRALLDLGLNAAEASPAVTRLLALALIEKVSPQG